MAFCRFASLNAEENSTLQFKGIFDEYLQEYGSEKTNRKKDGRLNVCDTIASGSTSGSNNRVPRPVDAEDSSSLLLTDS